MACTFSKSQATYTVHGSSAPQPRPQHVLAAAGRPAHPSTNNDNKNKQQQRKIRNKGKTKTQHKHQIPHQEAHRQPTTKIKGNCLQTPNIHVAVAQLAARRSHNPKVVSSTLTWHIFDAPSTRMMRKQGLQRCTWLGLGGLLGMVLLECVCGFLLRVCMCLCMCVRVCP